MIQAKRIGHASFVTPDLERQIAYYQQVVGLGLVARQTDRAFLAAPTRPACDCSGTGLACRLHEDRLRGLAGTRHG